MKNTLPAHNIEIGGQYRFDYPREFTTLPDYTAHAGQVVTVLRQLTKDEADQETMAMFEIEASDGWRGHADEAELRPIRRYISRIYIVVEANSQAEACDAMSGCLSENLKYEGAIIDWAYTREPTGYTGPRELPVDAPADLDPPDPGDTPDFDSLYGRRLPAEDPTIG